MIWAEQLPIRRFILNDRDRVLQKVESGLMKIMFPGQWSWEVYDEAWDILSEKLKDSERKVLQVRIRFPDGI